jgi:ketosteroid isomerase-like protein
MRTHRPAARRNGRIVGFLAVLATIPFLPPLASAQEPGGARALAEPQVTTSGPLQLTTALRAAEESFARAFAERDAERFFAHLAPEATFLGGPKPLRGAAEVETGWRPFFASDAAPFSWHPTQVAVADDGKLGVTSGPVLSPDGQHVGAFVSVWRRESNGTWRILFDTGPPCPRCQ